MLLVLVVVVAVAAFVAMPLRRGEEPEPTEDPRRAALEARRESKYREIRDAELDRNQGKLSNEDWARLDAELRREAIEILRELDALDPG